jgi:hypothetical protein
MRFSAQQRAAIDARAPAEPRDLALASLDDRSARSGRGTTDRSCELVQISLDGPAAPQRARPAQMRGRGAVRARARARVASSSGRASRRAARRSNVEPPSPGLEQRSAFCSASLKVRPIAIASPTDFICVVSVRSAPGNFSKAKRGILVTT